MNKDNIDLNKQVLRLISLLKNKDSQLKKIGIEVIVKKKTIKDMIYLWNIFNRMRYHYILFNKKRKNYLKIDQINRISINGNIKNTNSNRNSKKPKFLIRYEETIQYQGKISKGNFHKELIEDFRYMSELIQEDEIKFEIKPKIIKNIEEINSHVQTLLSHQVKKVIYSNNETQTDKNSKNNNSFNSIVNQETEIEYFYNNNFKENIYTKPLISRMNNNWNSIIKVSARLNHQYISIQQNNEQISTIVNNINSFNNISQAVSNSLSIIIKKPMANQPTTFSKSHLLISNISHIKYLPTLNFNTTKDTLININQIKHCLILANTISLIVDYSSKNRTNHFFQKLKYKSLSTQMLFGMKICKQLLIRTKLNSIFKSSYSKLLINSFHKFKYQTYITLSNSQSEKLNHLDLLLNNQESELAEAHNVNSLLKSQMAKFQSTFTQYDQSFKSKLEQMESKYISTVNQLKRELKEKNNQYEKLKKISSDSALELINSSNANTQQQLEINQLTSDNKQLAKSLETLSSQLSTKEQILSKSTIQIEALKKEITSNESKKCIEAKNNKVKISNYQNQIDTNETQITNLLKENKKLQMTIKELVESNEHYEKIINETKGVKNENFTLKEKVDQYENSNRSMAVKYNKLKEEYDELKMLSEESKKDLANALNEMQGYSSLLQLMQQKMEDSEQAKLAAENERDNAKNEIKTIRQRYINIIGENKLK